jgi:hypothetical protein
VAEKVIAIGDTFSVWGDPLEPLFFVLIASSTSGKLDKTCENLRLLAV